MKRAPSLLVLVASLALAASSVEARMYQWVNPSTGSVQMSGEPPPWYRSAGTGPRVYVFENGFLVDDTAIEVSESRKASLRRAAFAELRERRTLEALARVQAGTATEEDREIAARAGSADEPEVAVAAPVTPADAVSATDDDGVLPDLLDAAAIERLKQIIADFDRGGQ